MKVLTTGFEPFGGELYNPSFEAVRALPDQIGSAEIIKKELPVLFDEAARILEETITVCQPDLVLCVGQAGSRAEITPEKAALNVRDARIPDNAGRQPVDVPIQPEGPAAYFSQLPVHAMAKAIRQAGIPARVSYSAGTFVCNDLLYHLLDLIEHKYPDMKGGFIHVPFESRQVFDKPAGTPSLPLEQIVTGLQAAILAALPEAGPEAATECRNE